MSGRVILLSVLLCSTVTPVSQAAVEPSATILRQLAALPLPPPVRPTVVERVLRNGMRCFFAQDRVLPLFRFGVLFPGGKIYDPQGKAGLHGLLTTSLETGGTTVLTPEALEAQLDAAAIEINFSAQEELGRGSVSALAEAHTQALELFFAMMYAPRFDAQRLDVARDKMREAIRRRDDNPEALSVRQFRALLFGADNPWAQEPEAVTVAALTVEELQALHATLFAPAQMLCAAAGDFDIDTLVDQIERLMVLYPEHHPVPRQSPAIEATPHPGVWISPKTLPQSVINVGHLGLSRDNPDKYAMLIMNGVLGSPDRFNSWLMSTIRTTEGLAYEAWSHLRFGPTGVPGVFQAHSKTRTETTGRTVELIWQQIREMAAGTRVTAEEVRIVVDAQRKRMLFQYEDPYRVVEDMMEYVYFGLPTNYAEVFQAEIAKVTLADVQRVAQQYLHPEDLTTLVVGNAAAVQPQLQGLGEVQIYTSP